MNRFREVPKYRNRMTRFQIPNTDIAVNPSSGGYWLETHYLGVLHKPRVGYIYTCARATLFLHLENGWTDCAEIRCVVLD